MLKASIYRKRREELAARLKNGIVVLGGHRQLPMNIPMNSTPARQSSHMLYLTGLRNPNTALLLRFNPFAFELFGPQDDPSDIVWHGPHRSFREVAESLGATEVFPLEDFEKRLEWHFSSSGGPIHWVPSADPRFSQHLLRVGVNAAEFGQLGRLAKNELADALVEMRLRRDEAEVQEMRDAVTITARAYEVMMAATGVGVYEAQLRALLEGMYRSQGVRPSFDPIVTIRGEVLHCESNPNRLEENDLLLVDTGCETADGYASDVTRTWPVRGRFDGRQRAIYEIVLRANMTGIEMVTQGREYQDIHYAAAKVIAEGLKDLGILKGNLADIVDTDAHALFFPHGVGHLLGLDVHDIEDLGDRAGYAPGRHRSNRFGLGYLRLNRTLEPGMVVTIEPGIYFIPGLLEDAKTREQHRQFVDFDRACSYLGFGGIRIEDNVLVTAGRPEVLTAAIPKQIDELEARIGRDRSALGALSHFTPTIR